MTIQIRKKNGRQLPLHFSAGFIRTGLGSRLLAKIILQAVSQKAQADGQGQPEEEGNKTALPGPKGSWPGWLDETALGELLRALGRCLGRYRGLTLVEAESAQGDSVRIIL
ncbi:MAG: hypothetical protein HFG27_06805 [Provencibacterium sp.]|jgi:hypothetical protein|nr:hypothetical protein [Provencibacterium sp.]